jgi:uncharacterized integral membrane protein
MLAASVVSSLAVFLPQDNPVQQLALSNLDALVITGKMEIMFYNKEPYFCCLDPFFLGGFVFSRSLCLISFFFYSARMRSFPPLECCLPGALGLGVSLTQIHIYVDPLKKALQALWLLGLAGTLGLMAAQDTPAAVYVAEHPVAVWLVGPMFAALTGVAFKEGLCYGKAEAAGLFGATPLFLLGHLTGLLGEDGERGLLAAYTILLAVFALRKWTQAVKDDVGDKSVFEFIKLPPEIQEAKMREREAREARLRAAASSGVGMDLGRFLEDADE